MSVMVGWVDPQVNKFEQVSSDDHQMSLTGDGWVCPGGWNVVCLGVDISR